LSIKFTYITRNTGSIMKSIQVEDIYPDVKEAVRYFEHIEIRDVDWLAENLAKFWNRTPERDLLKIGRSLSSDELVVAGYDRWMTIGVESYSVLTPKGRKLGESAFSLTVARAKRRFYLADQFTRLRRNLACGSPFKGVMISMDDHIRTCAAAQALKNVLFQTAQSFLHLPLPECDIDICGCSYIGISKYEVVNE
jgi:hypothetical protein